MVAEDTLVLPWQSSLVDVIEITRRLLLLHGLHLPGDGVQPDFSQVLI
jgi:hypothetical protein